MKKFTVYDFKGVPHQSWNGERRIEKMTLKKCIEKVFSTVFQRNMKQFCDCNFYYESTLLTVLDIRDLVGKGYVFIPFSSNVDKDDVINYIKAGLKPLFMNVREYKTMKKAYEEIA